MEKKILYNDYVQIKDKVFRPTVYLENGNPYLVTFTDEEGKEVSIPSMIILALCASSTPDGVILSE